MRPWLKVSFHILEKLRNKPLVKNASGYISNYIAEKGYLVALQEFYYGCLCSIFLPLGALSWSEVSDYDVS